MVCLVWKRRSVLSLRIREIESLTVKTRNSVKAPSFHCMKLPWVILNGLILPLVRAVRKMLILSQQACGDVIRGGGKRTIIPACWHAGIISSKLAQNTFSSCSFVYTSPQLSTKMTTRGTSISHNSKMTLFKLWTESRWAPVVSELKQKRQSKCNTLHVLSCM